MKKIILISMIVLFLVIIIIPIGFTDSSTGPSEKITLIDCYDLIIDEEPNATEVDGYGNGEFNARMCFTVEDKSGIKHDINFSITYFDNDYGVKFGEGWEFKSYTHVLDNWTSKCFPYNETTINSTFIEYGNCTTTNNPYNDIYWDWKLSNKVNIYNKANPEMYSKNKNLGKDSVDYFAVDTIRPASLDDVPEISFEICVTNEWDETTCLHSESWWSANYTYRKQILLNNSVNVALNGYPYRLAVDFGTLIDSSKLNASCSDVRFLDTDEITGLIFEIVPDNCNSTNAELYVNVTLNASSQNPRPIYMYYGSATEVAPAEGNPFDANFLMVHHFESNTAPVDTTGTTNLQIAGGAPNDCNGVLGGGVYLDGNDWFDNASSHSLPSGDNDRTLEIWVNNTDVNQWDDFANWGARSGGNWFSLSHDYTGSANKHGVITLNGEIYDTSGDWTAGVWEYTVATLGDDVSEDNVTVSLNGTLKVSGKPTNPNTIAQKPFCIGSNCYAANRYVTGQVDELRISDIIRSISWIAQTGVNIQEDQFSFGAEETGNNVPTLDSSSIFLLQLNSYLITNISDSDSDSIDWVNYTLQLPNGSIPYSNIGGTWIVGNSSAGEEEEWHSLLFNFTANVNGLYQWLIATSDGTADVTFSVNISLNITDPYLEVGTPDGSPEWSYTGFLNETNTSSDFSAAINTAINNGACDCTGCIISGSNCTIPFQFHSDTAGRLEYSDINISYDLTTDRTNNDSMELLIYYSAWNYNFPAHIDYLEFIPRSPVAQNITPFGQTPGKPILNITSYGYGGMNTNFSIYLNETHDCVDLTMSTTSDKSAGFVVNATWRDFITNITYLEVNPLWMWADYSCNYTTWRLWQPSLSFRNCCEDCLCSEEI